VISESACADSPGTFLGNGTVCDPNPCPQPGACCSSSGFCQVLDEEPCTGQGGVYLGDGTSCDPNPCETGACCIEGECIVQYEELCDGDYQGDETNCDPNVCPQPATGACCIGDGLCLMVENGECDGDYQGDDTACDPNPCPQPALGACCVDGACSLTEESGCTGTFQGVDTSCDPDPCAPLASMTFLESGVTHFQTYSRICLRAEITGLNVVGAILTVEVTGGINPGTEELVVGGDNQIALDRDIFVYDNYQWRATRLDSRDTTYKLTGDVEGVIEVDAENRPCNR
jgi:hypothetical protein